MEPFQVTALRSHISDRLRRARTEARLSQAALGRLLAEATGEKWPQSRVWKLLHAKLPLTIETLSAAAHVLGLSLLDLLAHPSVSVSTGSGQTGTQLRVLQLLQREHLLDHDAEVAVIVLRRTKPKKPAKKR